MKHLWPRLRALGAAVFLFAFLAGPTPGHVKSCNDDSAFADPVQFCEDREGWKCARRLARGEITMEEQLQCIANAETMCSGLQWPVDCEPPPSKLQTQNCINALMDPATLGSGDDLIQCNIMVTLCPPPGI